jgi:hypothetical protein
VDIPKLALIFFYSKPHYRQCGVGQVVMENIHLYSQRIGLSYRDIQ